MPYGLHGPPATFQRLMDKVLYGLSDFPSAYVDDVVVYSNSWEEHMEHLRTVFECLDKAVLASVHLAGLMVRPQTEYLGYVIGNGVIKPQVQKVQAIAPDQTSAEVIPGHVRLVPQVLT